MFNRLTVALFNGYTYTMRAREVNRKIEKLGGTAVRQVGSHRRYEVERGGLIARTVVPQHTGDIPTGTLHAIQRDLEPVLGRRWLL